MKKHTLFALTVLLAASTARAQNYRQVYTRPELPPREALERLNLQTAWYVHVPTDGRRDGLASVQVNGRDLFVQTRAGLVVKLDAETGQTRWRTRAGNPYEVRQALGFNSRSVFVVNRTDLIALDRDTGVTQWEFSLPAGVSAPPIADEVQIYLSTSVGRFFVYFLPLLDLAAAVAPSQRGAPPGAYAAGERAGAVNASTDLATLNRRMPRGLQPTLRWDYRSNFRLDLTPVMSLERILLVGPDGTVVGLGKAPQVRSIPDEVFRFRLSGPVEASPGRFGETAYVGSEDGNLYALDMINGRLRWRYTAGEPVIRRPVVAGSDLYVTARHVGMARLNRDTGDGLWRVSRGGRVVEANPDADRFLAANPKFVYATDRSGRLLVLDRHRGTTLSRYNLRDFSVPVRNEVTDRLYLAANSGLLLCLHDREYAAPVFQRNAEDEVANAVRKQLTTVISEPDRGQVPLREVVQNLEKRHGIKKVRVAEGAFRAAGINDVLGRMVKPPKVEKRPLGEFLQKVLDQVGGTYQIIEDTLLILPGKPKQ